jgi:hypothetical protein
MSRRDDKPPLTNYGARYEETVRPSYSPDVTAEPTIGQQPDTVCEYMPPKVISSPGAINLLGKETLIRQQRSDETELMAIRAALAARHSVVALTAGGHRLAIEGAYRALGAGGQPQSSPTSDARRRGGQPQGTAALLNNRTEARTAPKPSSDKRFSNVIFERFAIRKNKFSVAAATLAVASLAAVGVPRILNGSEAASALVAQPKEFKNDTFACGTEVARANFKGGQGIEIRMPIDLKEPGHKAYFATTLSNVAMNGLSIAGCGARINNTTPAVWARYGVDKDSGKSVFTVDRTATNLTVQPGDFTPSKDAKLSLHWDTLKISNLPFVVDGNQVDFKKFPFSATGIKQFAALVDTTDPKKPKFTTGMQTTLAVKIEAAVLQALDNPAQCPAIQSAVDQTNEAYLSKQKSVSKDTLTLDAKTVYGQASTAFANNSTVKPYNVSNILSISGFNISCDAAPVLPQAVEALKK